MSGPTAVMAESTTDSLGTAPSAAAEAAPATAAARGPPSETVVECGRAFLAGGLLGVVLFQMDDGQVWCAPELSSGARPLNCASRAALAKKIGKRRSHELQDSWMLTLRGKAARASFAMAQSEFPTRNQCNDKNGKRRTLLLISAEALESLLLHTPAVKVWARGLTAGALAGMLATPFEVGVRVRHGNVRISGGGVV